MTAPRLWVALGTRATAELTFFARVAGRMARAEPWPILCLDTDRAPRDTSAGPSGGAETLALSGFTPRRFAEERLETDPASLAWLSPAAFDRLPRDYLHEAPALDRVLGRLAYERARPVIRRRLELSSRAAGSAGGRLAAGIALDAGGGMSGAVLPLLEDLWAAARSAGLVLLLDVVVSIDPADLDTIPEDSVRADGRRARAYATLRELERVAALPRELSGVTAERPIRRVHLLSVAGPEVPFSGLLELVQSLDAEEAPKDELGKIDRESAVGRLFEATAHAAELDAGARAPKLFFLTGVRELVFPIAAVERALAARYEQEVVDQLAADPRRTGRAGQALPRHLLDLVSKAAFGPVEARLTPRAAELTDVLVGGLASLDRAAVRAGELEARLEALRVKLLETAEELSAAADPWIDAALPAARAALSITPHVRSGISLPACAEGARAAVELARGLARSLEGGRKGALTAEQAERRWARLLRKEGLLGEVHAAAERFLSADRRAAEALRVVLAEVRSIVDERLRGVIAAVEARFWRRASISELRSDEPSPLEAHARALARLVDCQLAATLTQLDYDELRKRPPAERSARAPRLFLPNAQHVREVERLAEHRELFAPMLAGGGAPERSPAFAELGAILDALEAEDGITLESEARTADPARFVGALKRVLRERAGRLLAAKVEPRLSLYLGRLRPDARAELARDLAFEVPFAVSPGVLDERLDRPAAIAAGGFQVPDSPPLVIPGLHGAAALAWDRVVVARSLAAVPLFAIHEVATLRECYDAALEGAVLHPELRHQEEARTGTWSLAGTRLPASRALAEETRARIGVTGGAESLDAPSAGEVTSIPAPVAAVSPSPAPDDVLPPAAELPELAADTTPSPPAFLSSASPLPITTPHPEAIATFARARAVTRAIMEGDALGESLTRALPVRLERFSERERLALIELERLPGEGWQVYASAIRTTPGGAPALGERVALGRWDLAANLLAYSAQPELVRSHQAILAELADRLERSGSTALLDEACARLALRITQQRDEARGLGALERSMYDALIDALRGGPTSRTEPARLGPL